MPWRAKCSTTFRLSKKCCRARRYPGRGIGRACGSFSVASGRNVNGATRRSLGASLMSTALGRQRIVRSRMRFRRSVLRARSSITCPRSFCKRRRPRVVPWRISWRRNVTSASATTGSLSNMWRQCSSRCGCLTLSSVRRWRSARARPGACGLHSMIPGWPPRRAHAPRLRLLCSAMASRSPSQRHRWPCRCRRHKCRVLLRCRQRQQVGSPGKICHRQLSPFQGATAPSPP
mmetsp:Transcript_63353/g.136238  ORF Transcript_63353/g.136238 Transcript_63353/m.136238 type:complete len:232 (-) Transcript_63353:365-1060(-)